MNALLICPAERPGVAQLAEAAPLVVAPLLGRTLIEYWIESLVARGAKHIVVLAADRPNDVRKVVGNGTRWGVQLDLIAQPRELSVEEAHQKFCRGAGSPVRQAQGPEPVEGLRPCPDPAQQDCAPAVDLVVLDHLPGLPDHPLFESYAGWFEALQSFLPRAVTPDRIGAHQVQPGAWVGLHAQISPTAQLRAPCWIGERAVICDGATVGPHAIIEDRAVIEQGALVARSAIGPETFVGQHICVQHSLASGSTLLDWQNGSCLQVPDAFFLCSLNQRDFAATTPGLTSRMFAALAMLVTAPAAMVIMMLSFLRGEPPMTLRLGVRPLRGTRGARHRTFAYYELTAGRNWLRRWPQFWCVLRGDLRWVGNRPLRPTEAQTLANDFERLWLAAPIGLVSLADAHGCVDTLSDETIAHSSYYAVNASRRLDCWIIVRTICLAAANWPIRWHRRKPATVAVPQLAPK